ncbi:MAG TPA: protein kinase [Ktedonobacteraceae bacterium]|nr:protein kinase [Ktedonobacteraceae bacterium]
MTSVLIDSSELLGKTLGSSTLDRLIGRGGMGAVYLAQQSRPRRAVAIKVLMPGAVLLEEEQHAEFLTRFRREADAIAALDHINIMPLYEYGEEGQLAYLVMPYVTGGSLRDALEKQGKFSISEALPILEQAAAGLNYAHERGIVHRDLKPGNILFHSDGRALLADFGLAKMIRGTNELEPETLTALTTAGMVVGTPEYLSPEQANAMPVDQRTDIYSLGIVLYQMLCGRLPFTGATPVAIAIKHMMEQPPSLSAINQSIPKSIEAVIMKAIAKNPDDRYKHANDLVEAYREATNKIITAHKLPKQPAQPAAPASAPPVKPVVQSVLPPPARNDVSDLPTAFVAQPVTPQQPKQVSADQHATQLPGSTTPIQPEAKPDLVKVSLSNEATAEVSPEAKTIGTFPASAPADLNRYPTPSGGSGKRPIFKILLALVVVVLLAGGLITVLVNITHSPNTGQQEGGQATKKKASPIATATTPPIQGQVTGTPTGTPAALHLPGPLISTGSLLYGTLQPGSCDTYGGSWSTVGSTQVSCDTDDTSVSGNDDITHNLSGIFLDKMANGPVPTNNFTVQFQANIKSGDGFGIFGDVNAQHNSGMSIRVMSSGNIDGYSYGPQGNSSLFQVSTSPLSGWTTYTVVFQGSQMTLYINGKQVGFDDNTNITSGTFGLGSNSGSDVLFKNVGVYSAS